MMNGALQRTFQPVLLILTLAVLFGCGSRAVGEAPVAPGIGQGTSAASVTATPTVLVAALSPTTAATHLPEPTAAPSTASPTQTAIPSSTPTLEPAATATATPTPTPAPTATVEPSPTPTPGAGPSAGERLVAALRRGGYILYFRHAATDPSPDDKVPVDLSDCSTQRNLSEAGRAQSAAIGSAIRKLGIPIGEVLASPFCRTLDTARLAFGRAKPEFGVENLETVKDDAERDARVAAAQRLLSTPPTGGTNTVVVAHGNILSAAPVTVVEGGAAIFRPEGDGRYTLVATITPAEWGDLTVPAAP